MKAKLLDGGRTVLIAGIRISVELIADALITDSPRRQVVRKEAADGNCEIEAIESCRFRDVIHYDRHLLSLDEEKITDFLRNGRRR